MQSTQRMVQRQAVCADLKRWFCTMLVGFVFSPVLILGQSGFGPVSLMTSTSTSDAGADVKPQLVSDHNGSWLSVWSSSENLNGTAGTDFDLLFSRSEDGGVSWSTPELLNLNGIGDTAGDFNPRVATDGKGRFVVVWNSNENLGGAIGTDHDIFVSVSTNGGANWSTPVPVHSNAATDTQGDYNPWVATDGQGVWSVVWDSTENLNTTAGTDQDILMVRSDDDGLTWSSPAVLYAGAIGDSADDFQPSITSDHAGNWVAAWSFFDSESDILVSASTDNALTWSVPVGLHSTAYVNDGQDFVVHATTDRNGVWMVAWESGSTLNGTIDFDQDILVSRSIDKGASWSLPIPVNSNADSDSDLDSFPWLGSDGDGNWITLWLSETDLNGVLGGDSDILMASSLDGGLTWNGPLALAENATSDVAGDFNPQIVSDRGGRWLAVWNSSENLGGIAGTDHDLLVSKVVNPFLWTAPQALHSNVTLDVGNDYNPFLASDRNGNVIAVWASSENLNATAGTDFDIFYARSGDNAATWSAPTTLYTYANADNQTDRSPQVAFDGSNTWMAVWDSTFNLNNTIGTDQDILMTLSTDNGATWSNPVAVNGAVGDVSDDFNPSVTGDGLGNWVVVWNSVGGVPFGADFDVLAVRSIDNGATWSSVIPLKSTSATDANDDFDPEVITDGKGHWASVWFSNDPAINGLSIGDDDDIVIVHSYDQGASWSTEVPLNSNAASDDAEADDFTPRLAADGRGNWVVAWHSEGMTNALGADHDILFTRSVNDGTNWSPVAILNANAASDTGDDDFVSVQVDERGRWIAGWNSREPALGGNNIAFATSFDAGATWTLPGALNEGAMLDADSEGSVSFVRGDSNVWISAWHTTYNLGGAIGTDADVIFVRAQESDFPLRITQHLNAGAQDKLRWHGGYPLYQVEWRPSLVSGTWLDLGAPTHGVSGSFASPSPSNAFFRVISGQ